MTGRILRILSLQAGLLLLGLSAQAAFSVDPLLVTDNSNTTNTQFLVGPATKLKGFPVFFRIELPPGNLTAWGVQIYTDNHNAEQTGINANSPDGHYAGFFRYPDFGKRLPILWQVYASIQGSRMGNAIPTAEGWAYIQDKSDSNLSDQWNDYEIIKARTLASYQGLAPYPPRGTEGALSPFYLYLAADFTGTAGTEQYAACLNVDLYNFGIDITGGGFCTPNPFTPMTGQRTRFNFFLENYGSPFKIRIYTRRGRLLKTITDSQEWDGRKENGDYAEGGLYIYQIEAESKRVSGTVVLIK